MWIEIDKNIFENSDFKGLNFLFQILSWYPLGSIPRYNIFIDLEKIKSTHNYQKLRNAEKDIDLLIETQFNDFINENKKAKTRDYIISSTKGEKNFDVEEAIRFFNQPVSIILENNKNDAYFIKAIIYHFDSLGKIKEHLKNGWIKFENAGGCTNVSNFIEGELKSFEELASRNNKNSSDYFRGIIILDSDREYQNQPIKNQYQILTSDLKTKNINNFHILEKRTMENYMPDDVFKEIEAELTKSEKELRLWINVYKNLDSTQKDYLNFNKGFSRDFADLDMNIRTLYANLSTTNFAILKKGFNFNEKNVKGIKQNQDLEKGFKNSFPKKFESSRVNKYTLFQRANSNELEDILNKINQLL